MDGFQSFLFTAYFDETYFPYAVCYFVCKKSLLIHHATGRFPYTNRTVVQPQLKIYIYLCSSGPYTIFFQYTEVGSMYNHCPIRLDYVRRPYFGSNPRWYNTKNSLYVFPNCSLFNLPDWNICAHVYFTTSTPQTQFYLLHHTPTRNVGELQTLPWGPSMESGTWTGL